MSAKRGKKSKESSRKRPRFNPPDETEEKKDEPMVNAEPVPALETLLSAEPVPAAQQKPKGRTPGFLVAASKFDHRRDLMVGDLRYYERKDKTQTKIVDMFAKSKSLKRKKLWLQFNGPGVIHQEWGVKNQYGKIYLRFPVMHEAEKKGMRELDEFLLARALEKNYWPETYKTAESIPTAQTMKDMKLYRAIQGKENDKSDGSGKWPPSIGVAVNQTELKRSKIWDHKKREIDIHEIPGQVFSRVVIELRQHYFQSNIIGTSKDLVAIEMAPPVDEEEEDVGANFEFLPPDEQGPGDEDVYM